MSSQRGKYLSFLREKAGLSKAELARLIQAHERSGNETESYVRRLQRFEAGETQKLQEKTLNSLIQVFGEKGINASGLKSSPSELDLNVWKLPESFECWIPLAHEELMWAEGQGEADYDEDGEPIYYPPDFERIQQKAGFIAQSTWAFFSRTRIRWEPATVLDSLYQDYRRRHIDEIWYRIHWMMQELDEFDFQAAHIWAMWFSRRTLMRRASGPAWRPPAEPAIFDIRTMDQVLRDAEFEGPVTGGEWLRSRFLPFISL